jgi:uncharacterized membrane protein
MDDIAVARAIHVLAVVVWIGGVSMVTTVVFKATRDAAEGVRLFEAVESRFSRQAHIAVLLAGASGFYMVERLDLWNRFADPAYWWMHAMVAIWLLFTLVLFVAEPLFLHRWFAERARRDPQGALRLARRFHWILLTLSLVTIFGAVAGSHGFFLF